MGSVSTIILSMKLFLMSAGVLSLAARACVVIPITVKERVVPKIWSVIIAWSKPPYLFILFNFIIITIAATSRFTLQQSPDNHHHLLHHQTLTVVSESKAADASGPLDHPVANVEEEVTTVMMEKTERVVDFVQDKEIINVCVNNDSCAEADDDEDDQILEVHLPVVTWDEEENYNYEETDCYHNTNYDYGKHAETMDNTWKMITGERGHVSGSTDHAEIRKEISPGQEELNRRVEEFIKKINQDMRLERQRSLEQYMQMS